MKNLILLIALLTSLTGCYQQKTSYEDTRLNRTVTGAHTIEEVCLNNVTYYMYIKGRRGAMAVKYDTNGSVVTCNQ